MPPAHKDEFLRSSELYLDELKKASSFDEMLSLWRKTSIPYSMAVGDPYSEHYKNEVKQLYKNLTRSEYHPNNEMTSNKQSEREFEIGFPWISGNLAVVAEELAKPVQILQTLHLAGKSGSRIIEFGAGWGNLALPLARAQQDVSVVDIDQGFIDRILRKAEKEGLRISSYCGDFVEVASSLNDKFDVVIFQSSFHHCLDFKELLAAIRRCVLANDGIILFASEPIYSDIEFPWGLRYDGESLWAIMCNKWLELGFDHDFFSEFLFNGGFFFEKVPGIAGYVGEAWKASRRELSLDFKRWELPSDFDKTFHVADSEVPGRFCTSESLLPGLRHPEGEIYELAFTNYGSEGLALEIIGQSCQAAFIRPNCSELLTIKPSRDPVVIKSETFIPDLQCRNGDSRALGVSLDAVRVL
jgi:2-polyprenyl-3-methyl-5-hydroxy-6-metoxy-1,4-benzoquinol methylase